ncbi:hypothetical protein D3C81_1780060 [compost metagenome]
MICFPFEFLKLLLRSSWVQITDAQERDKSAEKRLSVNSKRTISSDHNRATSPTERVLLSRKLRAACILRSSTRSLTGMCRSRRPHPSPIPQERGPIGGYCR